jgi:hypothetical protein
LNEIKVLALAAKHITETRADQEAFVAGGRAADHAEYRHVCGVIRGLTHAETIVKDLVQRMEQSDE